MTNLANIAIRAANKHIIRKLPEHIINRIAAGEVVERPASVVKELVENAIDADAKNISITISNGGKDRIAVQDDGSGIAKDMLELALTRHATSKLKDNNIMAISQMGFRGEALPAIASVGRLKITSRTIDDDMAYQICADGGKLSDITPSSGTFGTKIELDDLFCYIPARLKFLKSDRAEQQQITDIVSRIAMAHPDIQFTLQNQNNNNSRKLLSLDRVVDEILDGIGIEGDNEQNKQAYLKRISDIVKKEDFAQQSQYIEMRNGNVRIFGWVLHNEQDFASKAGNSQRHYWIVNGRPVRDKLLQSAMAAACSIERCSAPQIAFLSITLPQEEIDVNVHPAKTEIRFRTASHIRGLVINALRNALSGANGNHNQQQNPDENSNTSRPSINYQYQPKNYSSPISNKMAERSIQLATSFKEPQFAQSKMFLAEKESGSKLPELSFLGKQSFGNYQDRSAISEAENVNIGNEQQELQQRTDDITLISNRFVLWQQQYLIDLQKWQAHDILQQWQDAISKGKIIQQQLRIPVIINLEDNIKIEQALLTAFINIAQEIGFSCEIYGSNMLMIRAIPKIIADNNDIDLSKAIICCLSNINTSDPQEYQYKFMQYFTDEHINLEQTAITQYIRKLSGLDIDNFPCPATIIKLDDNILEKLFIANHKWF